MKLKYMLMLCGGLCHGKWSRSLHRKQMYAEILERKGELIVPDKINY